MCLIGSKISRMKKKKNRKNIGEKIVGRGVWLEGEGGENFGGT